VELGYRFLPTTVRGLWLHFYQVVDVWSRRVFAWDVAEVESADIAADLVQRACFMQRYRRPSGFGNHQYRQQPLILHAYNGNAMCRLSLESRLEEMGCSDPSFGPGSPRPRPFLWCKTRGPIALV